MSSRRRTSSRSLSMHKRLCARTTAIRRELRKPKRTFTCSPLKTENR